jgi:hypothetical protein
LLDEHPEAWQPLSDATTAGDITLLYSSRDAEHNNAVALREYLMARLVAVGGARPAGLWRRHVRETAGVEWGARPIERVRP